MPCPVRVPMPCLLASIGALVLGACAADISTDGLGPDELGPDALDPDEVADASDQALASGTLRLNDVYRVPKRDDVPDVPVYTTASGDVVVRRIPQHASVKIVVAEPSLAGRYRVDHAGTLGWMLGADLALHHRYDSTLSSTRIDALARARKAMGFSYWWSNARWPQTGATTWPVDNRGKCDGICGGAKPCTHRATGGGEEFGSDCSGLVSAVWGFGSSDTNEKNNGFATVAYSRDNARWKTVELADAKPGDAIVRHDAQKEHIVLVATRRDSNKRFRVYECAGCEAGCRPASLTAQDGGPWHAIRKTGW